jgi:hypothetical protein
MVLRFLVYDLMEKLVGGPNMNSHGKLPVVAIAKKSEQDRCCCSFFDQHGHDVISTSNIRTIEAGHPFYAIFNNPRIL